MCPNCVQNVANIFGLTVRLPNFDLYLQFLNQSQKNLSLGVENIRRYTLEFVITPATYIKSRIGHGH